MLSTLPWAADRFSAAPLSRNELAFAKCRSCGFWRTHVNVVICNADSEFAVAE